MVQSDSDLICKVLSAMDYLKVCADHESPTGEGVPLDIAKYCYYPKNGSRPCALNVEVVIMVQHAQRRRGR
jgi:hypothetical protein